MADENSYEGNFKNPKGDQTVSPAKSNDHKCQVYVHQYNKILSNNYLESNWQTGSEMHQHLYKHEFSDFYDAKVSLFRKQFDNLSLVSRNERASCPKRILKGHQQGQNTRLPHLEQSLSYNYASKIPQIKSSPNAKINKLFLMKPENKAAIDKLEERYWTKWKPNKDNSAKDLHPKTKGLYTENGQPIIPYDRPIFSNRSAIKINKKEECVDSKETINAPELDIAEYSDTNSEESIREEPLHEENNIIEEEHVSEAEVSKDTQEEEEPMEIVEIPIVREVNENEDSECAVNKLKHTDSFIITSRKQNEEKPHFQQPKCIKLFKNAGYTSTAPFIRVKGGTYPLKSCLRKDSSSFGKPGSPITIRKGGKANRFTK